MKRRSPTGNRLPGHDRVCLHTDPAPPCCWRHWSATKKPHGQHRNDVVTIIWRYPRILFGLYVPNTARQVAYHRRLLVERLVEQSADPRGWSPERSPTNAFGWLVGWLSSRHAVYLCRFWHRTTTSGCRAQRWDLYVQKEEEKRNI